MYQTQWLVIGISGVTCGGKSTLATALYNYFMNNKNRTIFNSNIIIDDAAILSQDNYFLSKTDERHQWIKKLNHINWEIMSALDMDKMINDVRNLLTDQFILYDKEMTMMITTSQYHNQQQQQQERQQQDSNDNNHNSTIYLNNSHNNTSTQTIGTGAVSFHETTNTNRKIKILIIEGFLIFNHPQLLQLCQIKFHLHLPYEKCYERRIKRVYDPPDVTGYFEMCVWPMYEKHFKEFKDCDDIYILNGETPKEKIFKYVLNCISNYL